jgi:hypothetical protein
MGTSNDILQYFRISISKACRTNPFLWRKRQYFIMDIPIIYRQYNNTFDIDEYINVQLDYAFRVSIFRRNKKPNQRDSIPFWK